MFEVVLDDFAENIESNPKLKQDYTETPLKNSIDVILDQITLDVVKILKYNRI